MKVAIVQPYLFPYLGYYQLIGAVDEFVLFDDVQFIKRGWINRNRILVNGSDAFFTLSVRHADLTAPIDAREWHDAPADTARVLRQIAAAYRKAPCFVPTFQLLQRALAFTTAGVAASIAHTLRVTCEYLQLPTVLRSARTLNVRSEFTGQARILEICRQLGATHYVNPPGGIELYDREAFSAHGVKLQFIQPTLPTYAQFENAFVPGLSIIDVLMFNPVQAVQRMVREYRLT